MEPGIPGISSRCHRRKKSTATREEIIEGTFSKRATAKKKARETVSMSFFSAIAGGGCPLALQGRGKRLLGKAIVRVRGAVP